MTEQDRRAPVPVAVEALSKRFGQVTAVDGLTFTARPGRVTAFLGPNGAGKTTTLRMLVGLVTPTAGQALVGGRPYRDLADPTRVVGAALEASGFHPGRTARNHLRVLARQSRLTPERADAVLEQVGLGYAADRRASGFSLGMRQRLSLASALLGDPQVLLLDEPANGLDPEGIAWMREHLRWLARQGRTVVVSSHLLAEVSQTADDVVIIARGRLVQHGPLPDVLTLTGVQVRVVTPEAVDLAPALGVDGLSVETVDDRTLLVRGCPASRVGEVAARAGVVLHELREVQPDLEQVFLDLVEGGGER